MLFPNARIDEAIEALYPLMMLIQIFLDNARYHHAKLLRHDLLMNHGRPLSAVRCGAGLVATLKINCELLAVHSGRKGSSVSSVMAAVAQG
jgi:hypothetical protein